MYAKFFKRVLDFLLSLTALILLSPVLLVLILAGAAAMRGNPFFVQARPGRYGKIFQLIKFRTMSNAKDENGNLLPDQVRLNGYGRFLRKTSLDELPELFNILIGQMSIIGPRPLLPEYLPYYTERESHRHDVRPGLSGLSQVNGRNAVTWEDMFDMDLQYVSNITFLGDLSIVFTTVYKVLKRSDVLMGSENTGGRLDRIRAAEAVQKEA